MAARAAIPRMPFTNFCRRVLKLTLTRGQRVLAKIAFDDLEPRDLVGEERAIARAMFGDVETIDPTARRILTLLLGRGSGKTTLAAAYALYVMVTADVRTCGPGDVPTVVVIAPRRSTAALSIRMSLEMARGVPELAALIESENADGFTLRRPHDGRLVAFAAFAASRGGASARGISILLFILDEAQFFLSDSDGSFVVNDRDVYRALIPRLMPGGKGVLISTPWPVETLMAELFEKNHGAPTTALAAKAPTLLMRDDDPEVAALIELERARDPENSLREFDCETGDISGSSAFFDAAMIDASGDEGLVLPHYDKGATAFCAADFGFVSDSSAAAVATRRESIITVAAIEELRPKRGAPLVPSEVVTRFADLFAPFGAKRVTSDRHYLEAVREHLRARNMYIDDAPDGQQGKVDVHLAARRVLNERRLRLPKHVRLIAQLKALIAKPTSGGGLQIISPRRAGMGHGDIASAVILAVWRASLAGSSRILKPTRTPSNYRWAGTVGRGFG